MDDNWVEDVLSVSSKSGLWKFPALLRKQGMCLNEGRAVGSDRRGVVNKSHSRLWGGIFKAVSTVWLQEINLQGH